MKGVAFVLPVVFASALLAGAIAKNPFVANACGIVVGVLGEHFFNRRERRRIALEMNASLLAALEACRTIVHVEQNQRAEKEREADHYRRLYLLKVNGR